MRCLVPTGFSQPGNCVGRVARWSLAPGSYGRPQWISMKAPARLKFVPDEVREEHIGYEVRDLND